MRWMGRCCCGDRMVVVSYSTGADIIPYCSLVVGWGGGGWDIRCGVIIFLEFFLDLFRH